MIPSSPRGENKITEEKKEKLKSDIVTFLSLNPMNLYTVKDIENVFYCRFINQRCIEVLYQLECAGRIRRFFYNHKNYYTIK